MTIVLLICLFLLLCLSQWFLSRGKLGLLCFFPTGLYLLIAGTATIRTMMEHTLSAEAAAVLVLALVILIAIDRISRYLEHNVFPPRGKHTPRAEL